MIAPTPRGRMSQKRRHAIFSEHCTAHNVAPCVNCGEPVHRLNDEWRIEHVRALGLLGKDTNPNCGPSHVLCAEVKTQQQDMPRIRKARKQAEAVGPREPSKHFRKPRGMVYDWKSGRYLRADPM